LHPVTSRGEGCSFLTVADSEINLRIIDHKTGISGFLSGFRTNSGIAGVVVFPSVLSISDGIRDDLILLDEDTDIE
jgi:hypothetical protein